VAERDGDGVEQRPELGGFLGRQGSEAGHVAQRLDDQRADAERAYAVLD
jgi:hypothetical protein